VTSKTPAQAGHARPEKRLCPFGLSIELWDRHFFTFEERNLRIFVFNDCTTPRQGTLRYGMRNREGRWISSTAAQLLVTPGTTAVLPVSITMPAEAGDYSIMAELEDADGGDDHAVSEKAAYVFDHLTAGTGETGRTLGVVGSREIAGFLAQQGFPLSPTRQKFHATFLWSCLQRRKEGSSLPGKKRRCSQQLLRRAQSWFSWSRSTAYREARHCRSSGIFR